MTWNTAESFLHCRVLVCNIGDITQTNTRLYHFEILVACVAEHGLKEYTSDDVYLTAQVFTISKTDRNIP